MVGGRIIVMKKFIIFAIFFTILFLSNFSSANENPKNLPDCEDNVEPYKWNNCYKYVGYGNGFEYSGTWKYGEFNGRGTILSTTLDNYEKNFKSIVF